MRVLIVHDRPEAVSQITEVVRSSSESSVAVEFAEDGVGAREKLTGNLYDLLIIDLTIPHIKGRTTVDYRTASELMQELLHVGDMVFPGDIIGITLDLDAAKLVASDIGPHLMAIIEETHDGSWKDRLGDKIRYCEAVANSRLRSLIGHHDVDLLLVTALDKELVPLRDRYESSEYDGYLGAQEFLFPDSSGQPRRGIMYSIGKSGQASAASNTQSLITFFRPKLAILLGFCGGVRGKAKLGDVVFFNMVYDWDYGKWFQEMPALPVQGSEQTTSETESKAPVFYARPTPIPSADDALQNAVRQFLAGDLFDVAAATKKVSELSGGKLTEFAFETSSAASGSAVVGSTDVVDRIRGISDDIRAIDMEAYGFYHAAKHTAAVKPRYLCVKAVADWSDGTKDDSLHSACCWLSADVVAGLVMSIDFSRW